MSAKSWPGNFFEDFRVGQVIRHGAPRTITNGERALYMALYGPRFAVQSSDAFARAIGYRESPIDDLLVFHMVLGKSVPDISFNAVANLGYAEGRFLKPVHAGATIRAESEIIGLKQVSRGDAGIVWLRTTGYDEHGDPVLSYARWVMVKKRDRNAPAPETVIPELAEAVAPEDLGAALPETLDLSRWDDGLAGSRHRFGDYEIGERIDHVDGATVEEAEHMMATRLWQNTARLHFDAVLQQTSRFKRRLIYGGHVISLARAMSFNGLAGAFHVTAINGGAHAGPLFAGDTVYAWSEIVDKADVPGRAGAGALRIVTWAVKNRPAADFPGRRDDGAYDDDVLLRFDYWAVMPK
ncbi:MAG TPA: MaoC family dehydratase [Thermopetrobacter sp.]|nr:MaoC family dehydratase [Thermopetrobacter sp.]